MKECKQCHQKYIPNGQNNKYCSPKCGRQYRYTPKIKYCIDCTIQINRGLRCINCNQIKETNRAKIRIKHKMNKARQLKYDIIHKLGGCKICGYKKCLRALSFHHVNPSTKKFTLDTSNLMKKKYDDIMLELQKCILLCQNCHAQLHQSHRMSKVLSKRTKSRYHKKFEILKKFNCECKNCKFKFHFENLQCANFHHIQNKKYTLDSLNLIKLQHHILEEELNKCILLCSNCHMEYHNMDLNSPSTT